MTRRRFSVRAYTARLAEFNGRCADRECGCEITATSGLEWDHIIPLELGGLDEIENLQPLCRRSHKVKTLVDVGMIAKAKRVAAKHLGIKGRKAVLAGSRASGWKKPLNGPAYRRES
jgi:hypothetical protein